MNLQLDNMTDFAVVIGTITLDARVELWIVVQLYTVINRPPAAWITSCVPCRLWCLLPPLCQYRI